MDINNNANAPIAPGQFDPRMNRRRTASRRENIRSTLSTIGILLTAPLIAVFLTVFVFQSYQVDGASMETTLSHNDRLIVWKLPKTWSKITGHGYIPKRGDIVVFVEPGISQFGQDPKKQLIKRVIGLPGERVTVRDGKLIVYNREHPEGFEPDKTLPYGDAIQTNTPIEGTWDIGPNEVFVVGDNRNNSLDSRTFGPINIENIVGKLVIRVLPLSEMQRF
jgi:signal peptidase I